jgi:glutamine synthetase
MIPRRQSMNSGESSANKKLRRGESSPGADTRMTDALHAVSTLQFNDDTMRRNLPIDVYMAFRESIDSGAELSVEYQNVLAKSMGDWAVENGAAQYSHVFYPMRAAGVGVLGGSSGLKHDAFLTLDMKSKDSIKPIESGIFTGEQLFKGETDGSSFPNGGLRSTHEAGAWTSWDRTSPPCVVGDTLLIPTILVSQNGQALDEKIPLLRSMDAVNREAVRLLRHLGDNTSKRVVTNVGPEQEFFVIDRELYLQRPDLMSCGRTVLGAAPAKGQEECLNYFSLIQPRVKAFFSEFHSACWELGISNAVMHNEVAPAQCEVSHIFTLTNVAADWNILMMDLMSNIAIKHGLVVLLHEKPFAHINGSGKHNNWGLFTDKGDVLFTPGKTPEEEARFMAFTSCLTNAVKKHGDVLRAGVASASNDHRLGAQEAPPAIISIYIGQSMEDHIDKIIAGGPLAGYKNQTKMISSGCSQVTPIEGRFEDRNRTAPLPFCGNRFEFRAVGSGQNIAWPLTCINTIMAESMNELSGKIESGKKVRDAVGEMYKNGRDVLFQGDNYSEEWKQEALEKRKLPNLPNTVVATAALYSAKNKKLFSDMKVYDNEELKARQANMFDAYNQIVTIEANVMVKMMETGYIPAMAADLARYEGPISKKLVGRREQVYAQAAQLTATLKQMIAIGDALESEELAVHLLNKVLPAMQKVRAEADEAEGLLCKLLYPYPNYQQLLFSHLSSLQQSS